MFKWVGEKVRNARVAYAFLGYEKAKRREHEAAADRNYSTAELEREIRDRMVVPERDAEIKFSVPASKLRSEIAKSKAEIAEYKRQSDALQRQYQTEIDKLLREGAEIKIRIDALYEEKDDSYAEMNEAKDSIDNWYSMSKCYLGNRGKEIPQSSIFGRSHDDLEYFKSKRQSAYENIKECKEAIDDLKDDRHQINESISKIKIDRREMYELKRRGVTVDGNNELIASLSENCDKMAASIRAIENEKNEFLQQARVMVGVVELESEINTRKTNRIAFMKSFDTDEAKSQRMTDHRKEWELQHSRLA